MMLVMVDVVMTPDDGDGDVGGQVLPVGMLYLLYWYWWMTDDVL